MFWTVTQALLSGLATTFQIFILTLLFSLPLGLVIALASMSKFKPLRYLMQTIVWIVRGTPLMLQLIIIFMAPVYGLIIIFGAVVLQAVLLLQLWPLPSTMPAISLLSSAAGSKGCLWGSGKPAKCWV